MGLLKKSSSSKSDSEKSDSKKTWFSSRSLNKRGNDNDSGYGKSSAPGPTSLVKHTESFDKRVLATEQNVQSEIKQASNRKDLRLQSSGGVLLFEGMTKEDLDEYSMKELREVDASIDDTDNNKNGTDFVNVPGNYDPVKSGFYSKKTKNYYDSDEDDKLANNKNSNDIGSNPAFCGCFGTLTD